jgi:hypothetical protein
MLLGPISNATDDASEHNRRVPRVSQPSSKYAHSVLWQDTWLVIRHPHCSTADAVTVTSVPELYCHMAEDRSSQLKSHRIWRYGCVGNSPRAIHACPQLASQHLLQSTAHSSTAQAVSPGDAMRSTQRLTRNQHSSYPKILDYAIARPGISTDTNSTQQATRPKLQPLRTGLALPAPKPSRELQTHLQCLKVTCGPVEGVGMHMGVSAACWSPMLLQVITLVSAS